ncbi:hypothetical protein DSO57_1036877 [Entomophthora muscae]|uniref:Uncharacterized protein n=1 Tax=Entomophthora muscae TaxID=34485 RepID=A0ACC2UJR2_9FUNG|nr:hypothetical protein DSO57_1036877 [Entomophthora muscae]
MRPAASRLQAACRAWQLAHARPPARQPPPTHLLPPARQPLPTHSCINCRIQNWMHETIQ